MTVNVREKIWSGHINETDKSLACAVTEYWKNTVAENENISG